jgi:hypothetical protein
MTLDLGRIIGRSFSMCWRHRWLWLLGVFGGGGFGLRGSFSGPGNGRDSGSTSAQVQAFLNEWLWLIVLVVVVLVVITLVTFLLSCVAVPAATWAGLKLDAGESTTLGGAWRAGVSRFWVYLRLSLLRGAIAVGTLLLGALLVLVGVAIFATTGAGSLWVLIPLGLVLVLALIVTLAVLGFLFAWSDRMPVLLGVGAVYALRTSARLARRFWGDTLLFAIVMGVIAFALGLGVLLAAIIASVPGAVVILAGLGANSTLVIGIGVVLVTLLGGAVFLAGGGFTGSLVQVAYAMACRDLCLAGGLELSPGITSPVAPLPAGLPVSPPAPA